MLGGVLQGIVYFGIVMLIGVLALGDWLWDSARRGELSARPEREEFWRSPTAVWCLVWCVLQGLGIGALAGADLLEGAGGQAVFYVGLTLLLPAVIAAGEAHAARNGTSGLVMTRWLLRRPERGDRAGLDRIEEKGVGGSGGLRRLALGMAETALLALIPIGVTGGLLILVDWRPDQRLAEAFRAIPQTTAAAYGMLGYLLISAALAEELLFRHFLLNRMLRYGMSWRAVWRSLPVILLVTALWALGHGGMMEPAWVKYVQIGVYGIALGVAQVRHGTEAAMTVHLAFNGATPLLALLVTPVG